MSKRRKVSVPESARHNPPAVNQPLPQQSPQPHHIIHHSVKQFIGPIPDPETLALYESVLPGSCERILTMAEDNAEHVRKMAEMALHAQTEESIRTHQEKLCGQIGALISVTGSFCLAALAMLFKQPVVAGIICSTTVIGLAAVFITNKVVGKGETKIAGEVKDVQAGGVADGS